MYNKQNIKNILYFFYFSRISKEYRKRIIYELIYYSLVLHEKVPKNKNSNNIAIFFFIFKIRETKVSPMTSSFLNS